MNFRAKVRFCRENTVRIVTLFGLVDCWVIQDLVVGVRVRTVLVCLADKLCEKGFAERREIKRLLGQRAENWSSLFVIGVIALAKVAALTGAVLVEAVDERRVLDHGVLELVYLA